MSAVVTWIGGAVVRCAGVCRGSLAAERWRWAIKELTVIMNKYGHSKPFKLSFTVPEVSTFKDGIRKSRDKHARGRNKACALPSLTPLPPSAPPFSFKHNRLPVVKLAFACVGSRHPSCSMRRPAEPRHSSAPATAPPLPFVHCVFVTFRHNCQCRPSHLHPAPPPHTRSVTAAALHPVSCLSLLLLHLPPLPHQVAA